MTKQERLNLEKGVFELNENDTVVLFRFAGLPEYWEVIIRKVCEKLNNNMSNTYMDPKFRLTRGNKKDLFNIEVLDKSILRSIVKVNGIEAALNATRKYLKLNY